MNTFFDNRTLFAMAVAIATATCTLGQAQDQPMPPPSAEALPVNIMPGTPLAEVVKLVQAGVDVPTIQSYIINAPSPFNLDADKIIFLRDEGVPSALINAMMDRDKALYASNVAPPPQPVPVTTVAVNTPDTAPPPEEVTVNYFYDTLTPYGSWVDVDGYGRCWRPTAVIYDSSWRPYGDRGHWVYTDYGWYWDSDYSWGVTFHYGRWFNNPRFGWCWYPDTVWAPSWVTWRSGSDYCGWAPLPPFAVFRPGAGFFYRGVSVGVDFDFGLAANSFLFISPDHFCDRRPRSFCAAPQYVTQIYQRTTVINNYNINNKTIINRGFGADRIASVTHRPIEPVHISSLPNAGRQGWHGEGMQRSSPQGGGGNNNRGTTMNNNSGHTSPTGITGNGQVRPGAGQFNNGNNNATTPHYDSAGHAATGTQQGGNQTGVYHPQLQDRTQPAVNDHVQPQSSYSQQQQQQTRRFDNYTAPDRGTSPNSQNVQPPVRTYNNSQAYSGMQQHGAEQLQQHGNYPPVQPRAGTTPNYVEANTHSSGQAISQGQAQSQSQSQSQPQPRNSGNGGNGGSNNNSGNGSNNGGSGRGDRQNH